ncbi:MAG: sulfite exporter TauE/SafE family protein, partial [Chloroflexota bacterium]
VGGFIGIGGGYMVTPALIVFGFPGFMASGIDMTHIAGTSIISSVRHRQMGNIDWTIALSMVAGTMLGVEMGVRALDYFKKLGMSSPAVLTASLILMTSLFIYTTNETRRSHKVMEQAAREGKEVAQETVTGGLARFFQNIPLAPIVRCRTAGLVISMWILVLVGVVTGALAGFLGVGGGFVRVPALVYLIGTSTHIAVGTDLAGIALSGAYGALRHTIEGNVDFLAVMFMLSGAVVGAQFGAISTAFVRGPAIRYILSYSLGLAILSALLPLADELTGYTTGWLMAGATIITLAQMFFLCTFILSMLAFALLARNGRWVPDWVMPLLVRFGPPVVEAPARVRTEGRETV